MGGFPQPVSHAVMFSRVLPLLMPGLIRGTAAQAASSVIFSGARGATTSAEAGVSGDRGAGGVRQPTVWTAQRSAAARSGPDDLRAMLVSDSGFIPASRGTCPKPFGLAASPG